MPDLALPHVGTQQTAMTRAGQAYANMLIDGTVTDVALAAVADVTFGDIASLTSPTWCRADPGSGCGPGYDPGPC